MRRDIMSKLLEWKNNPEKKPLIIRGVRQCGKTYIMKEFGKDNYSDMAYFNFEQDDISKYFEQDLVVERLVKTLGIHRSKSITENTLIIFDEIQICPRAITSLKYFCED
ncbi:MAG: AAA family ATPase, partial [Candidatus Methanomethylophilaceae archaeon]|nr:AAA family ATPase [Candidatus Methanomethylophilaceae archaeon]